MKKIIVVLALIATFSTHADSETTCWRDAMGKLHCKTVEVPSNPITPSW